MSKPSSVEIWSRQATQDRLAQLRAVFKKYQGDSQLYWSGPYRQWILLSRYNSEAYKLEFYKDCPC